MSQTNLKSDSFCSYTQEASIFYYTFAPDQYANSFVYGEVGLNASGGSPGSYVRQDVIDVDSFLSGRDDIISKCNPPVPGLDDVKQLPLVKQDDINVNILTPKYTKEKRSAIDLSSVDYNRWQPNLPVDPQNLRYIIEDFAPQRGGMDTSNYAKLAWKPTVERGAAINGNPNACESLFSPARANPYSASVSGFNPNTIARPLNNKPPMEPDYPFSGPTSYDIKSVGATACAENQFYGPNYDKGSCGQVPKQQVLTQPGISPGLQAFSLI